MINLITTDQLINKKRPKVALFSLTGCEGCYFAILDEALKLLELKDKVDIREFRLVEDDYEFPTEQYEISFVEGSPITEKNIKELERIRKNSKLVIALGGCAHLGGVYHLKKYNDKAKEFNHVYSGTEGIENTDVEPIEKYIKVDFTVPGCPITAEEFYNFIYCLLIKKKPQITQNPICYECQTKGYECLLQKGEVCFGPITQAGCGAICLKSKQGCWGCRGLVEEAEVANLIKMLKEKYSEKEIIKYMEIFGLKEQIN